MSILGLSGLPLRPRFALSVIKVNRRNQFRGAQKQNAGGVSQQARDTETETGKDHPNRLDKVPRREVASFFNDEKQIIEFLSGLSQQAKAQNGGNNQLYESKSETHPFGKNQESEQLQKG